MGHFAELFVFNELIAISFRGKSRKPNSSGADEAGGPAWPSFWKTVTGGNRLVKKMSISPRREPGLSRLALARQRKPAEIPLFSQDFEPKTGGHFSAILLGGMTN